MLTLFKIRPDYDLDLMSNDQGLTDLTVGALSGLDTIIDRVNPDWVMVQGDTTTTMAASMAVISSEV